MGVVKDYMARKMVSVSEDDYIDDTIMLMCKAGMSVLPVVNEENKFLGTIYGRNILNNVIPERYGFLNSNSALYEINQAAVNLREMKDRTVKEYMSTRTSPVLETDKMYKLADIMLDNKESILFVVNDKGTLRGYISRADLLYYLLNVCNKTDE